MARPRSLALTPGDTFSRLTFVADAPSRRSTRGDLIRRGLFRCSCGTEKVLDLYVVTGGTTRSCGCWRRERQRSGTPKMDPQMRRSLYARWASMRHRCTPAYWAKAPTYTGVTCDERWATFDGFLAHPPNGDYMPGMALSRFGDTGPYSPENCRWVTRSENSREMIERRMIRLPDGRLAQSVAAENGISARTWWVRHRRYGWPIERAVTEPVQHRSIREPRTPTR